MILKLKVLRLIYLHPLSFFPKVKSQLNKEQYGLFSLAVKNYQKSKDYDTVVGTLASLFSREVEHHRLFRSELWAR